MLGNIDKWLTGKTVQNMSHQVLKPPNMESWKQAAYRGITAFSAPLFAQTVVSLDLDCFKGSGHYLRCAYEGAIKKQRHSTGKYFSQPVCNLSYLVLSCSYCQSARQDTEGISTQNTWNMLICDVEVTRRNLRTVKLSELIGRLFSCSVLTSVSSQSAQSKNGRW